MACPPCRWPESSGWELTSCEGSRGGRRDRFPLSHPRGAWRRRHGRRLQGPGHAAQAPRRAEVPAAGADPRPRRQAALRPGSRGRLGAGRPARRHHLRHRPDRRRPGVHRHGLLRRRDPQEAHPARAPAGRARHRLRHADRARARRRPRRRHRPPRHQAGQRDDHDARRGQDRRLRHRQADRRRPDQDRIEPRHGRLHGARAVPRRRRRARRICGRSASCSTRC